MFVGWDAKTCRPGLASFEHDKSYKKDAVIKARNYGEDVNSTLVAELQENSRVGCRERRNRLLVKGNNRAEVEMKRVLMLCWLGVSTLAMSCALATKPVLLGAVGPDPSARAASTPMGFLRVYSAVKCYPYDRQYYFARTDYGVYDTKGNRVRSVQNAARFHDLAPALVTLPAGTYDVVAWADGYELVRVPVVIKAGQLTEVNLETNRNSPIPATAEGDVVRMDDGRIVGWSAAVAGTR
jgi:murein DD-endopeptidase MepM/ murein hydrolase activator NlpD